MTEGTKATVSKQCEICARDGRQSRIRVFQINFEEAVRLCENEKCTYPLGLGGSSSPLLQRRFSDMSLGQQRKNAKGKVAVSRKPIPQPVKGSCNEIKKPMLLCTSKDKFTSWNPHSQNIPGPITSPHLNQIPKSFLVSTPMSVAKSVCPVTETVRDFQGSSHTVTKTPIDKTIDSSHKPCHLVAPKEPLHLLLGSNMNNPNNLVHKSCTKLDNIKEETLDRSSKVLESECKLNDKNVQKTLETDKTSEVRLQTLQYHRFPQWKNKDALCWLDVIMCLLSHSKTVKQFVSSEECPEQSVLITLLKAYSQATFLANKLRKQLRNPDYKTCSKTNGYDPTHTKVPKTGISELSPRSSPDSISHLPPAKRIIMQTGAGLRMATAVPRIILANTQDSHKEDCPAACKVLNEVREKLWQSLQPRLRCEKGKKDSPVFAFPLLARESLAVEKLFRMKFRFELKCDTCGYSQVDADEKVLPTFPNVASPLNMAEPAFIRSCFKCSAPGQKRRMHFEELPEIVLLHFVEGLPHNDLTALDFIWHGERYAVTGIVQYKNSPDHFVAWIHNPYDHLWMECDDLKPTLCQFLPEVPDIACSEIHIVMWEKICAKFEKSHLQDSKLHLEVKGKTASHQICVSDEQSNEYLKCASDRSDSNSQTVNSKEFDSQSIRISVSKLATAAMLLRQKGGDEVSKLENTVQEMSCAESIPKPPSSSPNCLDSTTHLVNDIYVPSNISSATECTETGVGVSKVTDLVTQSDKQTFDLDGLQKMSSLNTSDNSRQNIIIVQGGLGSNISSETLTMVANAIRSQQPDAVVTMATQNSIDDATNKVVGEAVANPSSSLVISNKTESSKVSSPNISFQQSMSHSHNHISRPVMTKTASPIKLQKLLAVWPKQKPIKEAESRITKMQQKLMLLKERRQRSSSHSSVAIGPMCSAVLGVQKNSVNSQACRLEVPSDTSHANKSRTSVSSSSSYLGAIQPYLQNVLKRRTEKETVRSTGQVFEGYKPKNLSKNTENNLEKKEEEVEQSSPPKPLDSVNVPGKLGVAVNSKRKIKQEPVRLKRTKLSASAESAARVKSAPVVRDNDILTLNGTSAVGSGSKVNSATGDGDECRVLQNLYSALNIPFPDGTEMSGPPQVSEGQDHRKPSGVGNVSVGQDLLDTCLTNSVAIDSLEPSDSFVNALDDFLAEL